MLSSLSSLFFRNEFNINNYKFQLSALKAAFNKRSDQIKLDEQKNEHEARNEFNKNYRQDNYSAACDFPKKIPDVKEQAKIEIANTHFNAPTDCSSKNLEVKEVKEVKQDEKFTPIKKPDTDSKSQNSQTLPSAPVTNTNHIAAATDQKKAKENAFITGRQAKLRKFMHAKKIALAKQQAALLAQAELKKKTIISIRSGDLGKFLQKPTSEQIKCGVYATYEFDHIKGANKEIKHVIKHNQPKPTSKRKQELTTFNSRLATDPDFQYQILSERLKAFQEQKAIEKEITKQAPDNKDSKIAPVAVVAKPSNITRANKNLCLLANTLLDTVSSKLNTLDEKSILSKIPGKQLNSYLDLCTKVGVEIGLNPEQIARSTIENSAPSAALPALK